MICAQTMPKKRDKILTGAETQLLSSILDRVIPEIGQIPAAGQMEIEPSIVEIAEKAPRLEKALRRVIVAVSLDLLVCASGGFASLSPEEQDTAITKVQEAMPAIFKEFLEICYLAYYKDERVHARINWRSGPLQPEGFEMPPFDESVLEKVKKLEPFWRQTQ